MTDEFSNRLTSFQTTLTYANDPDRKAVWLNQVPKSFGTTLGTLPAEVTALQGWAQEQGASIGGSTEAKAKEEGELEVAAFDLAQALVAYYLDKGMLTEAEPFRRSISWWRELRDQDLLARSQAVLEAAGAITGGAGATAAADNFGISTDAVDALESERNDYEGLVAAPASARAGRKAYTALMREKFRNLDRLVTQFKNRPGGEAFIAGWFAARQVIDAGAGPATPPPAPAPPVPPTP